VILYRFRKSGPAQGCVSVFCRMKSKNLNAKQVAVQGGSRKSEMQMIQTIDGSDLAIWVLFLTFRYLVFEPQQRVHSPQLAAGLASEYKIRLKVLTVEDSLQLAAGFFNLFRISRFGFWNFKNKFSGIKPCEACYLLQHSKEKGIG
jgi:hypothetical protein